MPKICINKLKRNGINAYTYNFNQFYHGGVHTLKTLRINRSRPSNMATNALGSSLVNQQ